MVYNKNMNKHKGFTIVETALVLAVSTMLFAAIMYGITASVARRRYTDSINGIVEELKNAYSATINVENFRRSTDNASFFCSISSAFSDTGKITTNSATNDLKVNTDNNPGRSRCALYGQVITFGESEDSAINRYDLVGVALESSVEPNSSDDALASLANSARANIVTIRNDGELMTSCSASTAGSNTSFLPNWSARIENKDDRDLYHGAIMIVRSPISGTIHTYFYSNKGSVASSKDGSLIDNPETAYNEFAVQKWLDASNKNGCASYYKTDGYFIQKAISKGQMIKDKDLEFCVGSDDLYSVGGKRRAIRIHGDGSNENSVELLSESESAVACEI